MGINFCFTYHNADPERPESDAAVAHCVWQFLRLQIVVQQGKADLRMLFACFVTKPILAAALPEQLHILGRPVMGQDKAGIQPCVAFNKKDDIRREALRKAQKSVAEVICVKEQSIAGKKRKQQVIDDLLTSPTIQSAESPDKSGSTDVHAT